jgi:phthalate 4,5-dioxygenase oxygenase subunit
MLNDASNERMCRVDPSTPMGKAMRRYWLPALQSSDLPESGGDPKGVEMLGERFVAYRDGAGRAGFYDEACLHRGASMLLARAEPEGLRCIYHGWKFAVDGTVLETPNVADPKFKERIRGWTYPVREAGGLLWVYLGPAEHQPEFPRWPWMDLPASQVLVTHHVEECNYVQVIEGLVDSSHLGLLHLNGMQQSGGSDLAFAQKVNSMQNNLAPRMEAEETAFGFYYAALRDVQDGRSTRVDARVTAFIAPCTILNPNGDIMTVVVPIDDRRSAFFHVFWSETEPLAEEPMRSKHLHFVGLTDEVLDGFGLTVDTLGRADRPNARNNFMQDRDAMRRGESWSGLPGLIEEDVAVSVSAGPIRSRAKEMLSSADLAVVRLYRALLACSDALESGQPLPGQGAPVDWARVVGTHGAVTPEHPWQGLVPSHLVTDVRPVLQET